MKIGLPTLATETLLAARNAKPLTHSPIYESAPKSALRRRAPVRRALICALSGKEAGSTEAIKNPEGRRLFNEFCEADPDDGSVSSLPVFGKSTSSVAGI
jgi:hypothetical protein